MVSFICGKMLKASISLKKDIITVHNDKDTVKKYLHFVHLFENNEGQAVKYSSQLVRLFKFRITIHF